MYSESPSATRYSPVELSSRENNFLAALHFGAANVGLSLLDISTGEYLVAEGEMQRRKEVVFAARQHIVAQGYARCHQLRDAAFHQLLGEFRIFELVANRHTKAGTDESRQVVVERMVRETRHLRGGVRPLLVAFCQRDAQHLRGDDRILTIGFVKVAAAKQQNRVGVRRFHVVKLPHHWSEFFFGHRGKCVGNI